MITRAEWQPQLGIRGRDKECKNGGGTGRKERWRLSSLLSHPVAVCQNDDGDNENTKRRVLRQRPSLTGTQTKKKIREKKWKIERGWRLEIEDRFKWMNRWCDITIIYVRKHANEARNTCQSYRVEWIMNNEKRKHDRATGNKANKW